MISKQKQEKLTFIKKFLNISKEGTSVSKKEIYNVYPYKTREE